MRKIAWARLGHLRVCSSRPVADSQMRTVPSAPAGKSYTTLYDGGVGIVAHRQVRDLPVTLRLEFPLVVNRWNYAADWNGKNQGLFALRWQVSLESSF